MTFYFEVFEFKLVAMLGDKQSLQMIKLGASCKEWLAAGR